MNRPASALFAAALISSVAIADPPAPVGPDAEKQVVAVIEASRQRYAEAVNGMVQGNLRRDRAAALCRILKPAEGQVRAWRGTVTEVTSTGRGNGVLSVAFGTEMTATTVNIELAESDNAPTLIRPNSPVYAAASRLRTGDEVRFSGHFWPDKADCMREISLTTDGAMQTPQFLFAFSAVEPASAPSGLSSSTKPGLQAAATEVPSTGAIVAGAITFLVLLAMVFAILRSVGRLLFGSKRTLASALPSARAAAGQPAMAAAPLSAPIVIDYVSAAGEETRRTVTVHQVEVDAAGRLLAIKGYCHLARAPRTFLATRIKAAAQPETGEVIRDLGAYLADYGREE